MLRRFFIMSLLAGALASLAYTPLTAQAPQKKKLVMIAGRKSHGYGQHSFKAGCMLLKKALDDVAWAAFAGGLGVDLLATQVPGGRLVQATSTLSDWIYTKPPGDLKVWMEKSLKDMGVDQETIDLFLRQ